MDYHNSTTTTILPITTPISQTNILSLYDDIDRLINDYLSPTGRSNEKRTNIVTFIREVTLKSIPDGHVIEVGSSLLKSYLPESDLDLILLCPPLQHSDSHSSCTSDGNHKSHSKSSSLRDDMQRLTCIFNSWCEEISDKEEGISRHNDMTIRNIEFVNARTKLAHCLVNNISVDITVNQIGSLITITFLEEVDRYIGYNHLFKRSLILIKVSLYHQYYYYGHSYDNDEDS